MDNWILATPTQSIILFLHQIILTIDNYTKYYMYILV